MSKGKYRLRSKMFLWPGETANWHFLPIPKEAGIKLKACAVGPRRGFGSIPVTVTIGKTVWQTSIFPNSHSGSYILPIKAKVRKAEDLEAGDEVLFTVEIRS